MIWVAAACVLIVSLAAGRFFRRGSHARLMQALALLAAGALLVGLGVASAHLRYLNLPVGVVVLAVGGWTLIDMRRRVRLTSAE